MTDDEEEDGSVLREEHDPEDVWYPEFDWLTTHVAVGGRFPPEKASCLAKVHGVRAVVDLRAEDSDDEEILRAAGIDFLHLPTPDLQPATHEHLDRGVAFVRERVAKGEKVLIHCQHGIGRSALLALCVLVDRGWEPLDALAHAKDRREAVSPSLSQYEGWRAWLAGRGMQAPDYHTFGCIAYRHLSSS